MLNRTGAAVFAGTVICMMLAACSGTMQERQPVNGDAGFAPPEGFTARPINDSTIQLSWEPVAGADSFSVEWDAGGETRSHYYTIRDPNRTQLLVRHLAPNTEYTFYLSSISGAYRSTAASDISWLPQTTAPLGFQLPSQPNAPQPARPNLPAINRGIHPKSTDVSKPPVKPAPTTTKSYVNTCTLTHQIAGRWRMEIPSEKGWAGSISLVAINASKFKGGISDTTNPGPRHPAGRIIESSVVDSGIVVWATPAKELRLNFVRLFPKQSRRIPQRYMANLPDPDSCALIRTVQGRYWEGPDSADSGLVFLMSRE